MTGCWDEASNSRRGMGVAPAERMVADRGRAEGGPTSVLAVAARSDGGCGGAGLGWESAEGGQLRGFGGVGWGCGGGDGRGGPARRPSEFGAGAPVDAGAVGVRGGQDGGVFVPHTVERLR